MYTLRYLPDSASLIVRLVLEELSLPHTARKIDRDAGELASPEYRAIHPLGKIPAMETPDGPMFETAAMLLYLSDRHPGLAPAPGAADRAAFLKWLFFISSNIHPNLIDIFYPDRVAGPEASDAVRSHAWARIKSLLSVLNKAAASNPVWMPQDSPSLLGYYIAVLMRWLGQNDPAEAGYVNAADYPALHAVLAHLETRPAALRLAADEDLGSTIFTQPG